ncbi:MAG: J domain-containing protein [Ignavibacteriaceae bacterium]|nr:J domain-containing protein [Ignavibacteriaceae bacterium]
MTLTECREILGLSGGESKEEIRKAYLKRTLKYHPDKLSLDESSIGWKEANDRIKKLNHAYKTLLDNDLTLSETNSPSINYYTFVKYYAAKSVKENFYFDYENGNENLKKKLQGLWSDRNTIKVPGYDLHSNKLNAIISFVTASFLTMFFIEIKGFYLVHFIALIAIILTSYKCGKNLHPLIKFRKHKIQTGLLLTPLYLILTEATSARFFYLWSLESTTLTNVYSSYRPVSKRLFLNFKDFTLPVDFSNNDEYNKFVSTYNTYTNNFSFASSIFSPAYFDSNDILTGINKNNLTEKADFGNVTAGISFALFTLLILSVLKLFI